MKKTMKKSICAVFTALLLCLATQTHANSEYTPEYTPEYTTRDTTDQSIPSTVRPRMKVDKALLDSWIDETKYPTDYMSNPQMGLYVPESFYDYE